METLQLTDDWNGHSGAEVQALITNYLGAHQTDLNNLHGEAVTTITAGYKSEDDKTTIVINGYNKAGKPVTTTEFKTITEASYTQKFNQQDDRDYDCPSIIDTNTDLSIPYDYAVLDKNSARVAGFSATVTFEITCGEVKKVYTTSTYSSKASTTNRLGTFVIPKSYLGVGTNSIIATAITKVSDTSQTDIWTQKYTTYVADLQLKCSLSGDSFYNLREYDSDFTLNFSVTDSAGRIVPSTFTVYKSVYINRIGSNYCSQDKLTAESLATNYNRLVKEASLYGSANVDSMPYIRVLVQAYIIDDNNNKIVSNTVLMDMLNKTGLDLDTSSGLYWATMFENVTMDDSSVTIMAQQYDTVKYDFYLYSKAKTSYSITVDNEVKTSGTIPANILSPVGYSYIFRTSGSHEVSLGDFAVTTEVTALTTALSEPSGETLSLLASEKAPGVVDSSWGGVCTFSGFDWKSNGWVKTTDNGIQSTALLINNGASVNIDYALCDKSQYEGTTYPFTISFKYKIVNGTDESETLISCLSENTGIEIKPQYVSLHTSASIDQNISNDDVHEVTFVYYGNDESAGIYKGLQMIYIDGKYQVVSKAGAFVSHTNTISIQATSASLYLYSVKAFRKGLSFTEVQALYCFNQNDSSKIPDYIKKNNVFNISTNNVGDYTQNVKRTSVPEGSKVLVLYGSEEDPTPWLTINSYIKDANEVNKGRIHALKGMRLYVAGKDADARNFYAVNGSISAQGTSSMGYPIKNFRIYTNKNAKKSGITAFDGVVGEVTKFYQGDSSNPLPYDFDPEGGWSETELANWDHSKEYQLYSTEYGDSYTSAPANRFCLKADYAESSGTHNTGFARLSNVVLRDSSPVAATNITSAKEMSELPQQHAVELAESSAQWPYDVRFNIDGYPIYLFFVSPSYTIGNTEVASKEYYAGRYNMNNDKANTQVFGFEKVTDYFNNDIVKAEGKYIQKLALESGIDPLYAETHSASAEDTFINPIECWEFSSNDSVPSKIGSFYYDKDKAFTVTTGDLDPCDATHEALYWLNGTWEYRFPDLDDESVGNLAYRRGESKPYLLYKTYQFLYDNNYALNPTKGTLNKFADKVHLYFNVNSIIKYFVLTHMFCAVDQRVKNCMLAYYCDPYGVSAEEAEASPLHYMRGYYLFYDNDTLNSLNNAGAITQPWDFYETDTGSESSYAENYTPFPGNGIHGIWNNLQKCFELYRDGSDTTSSAYKLGQLVAEAYKNIRNTATDTLITKYLETEQCNQYPDAVHNVDLAAKYLNPNTLRVSSSTDSNVGGPVETPVHLDMAQGTREFHRKNWLSKRLHWLDDLYCATQADSYALEYKTGVTKGADKGTIKLQSDPAFRYWRFYGWTGTNKTLFKATKMLTPSETGAITIAGSDTEYLSNSDAFSITDLYGCKSIDFSDFTFDPSGVQQPAVRGTFPYLQSFILRKTSGPEIQSDVTNSILNWISLSAMPNLRTLYFCNVKPSNDEAYFSELNLRNNDSGEEFTKLETLDLRGTSISKVNLPNSPALTSISLTDPVELNLANKVNVSTLNINSDKLNTLTVSGSNSIVYTWALNAAIDNYGNNTKEFTISFGNGSKDPFVIDSTNSSLFTLLETLSDKVSAEGTTVVKISGDIYTAETYDAEKMEIFGDTLNIVSKLPDEGFSLEWGGKNLYEDSKEFDGTDLSSCLTVKANMNVSSWAIAIDGETTNSLDGNVTIVKSGSRACYIHANPYLANAKLGGKDHKLVVYATLPDGSVKNSYELTGREIMIYYSPIATLTVSADADNQYTVLDAHVVFDFGNHTKKQLLTKEQVEENPGSFSATLTNNATYSWEYKDNVLCGAQIYLSGKDTVASFTILGLTSNVEVFFNTSLITSQDTKPELTWLRYLVYNLIDGKFGAPDSFTKKDANKISLFDDNTWWASVTSYITTNEKLATQDFTNLQYFQLGNRSSGEFDIPRVPFSNLVTPKNTTQVNWSDEAVGVELGDLNTFETITFSSSVAQIYVNITFSSMPSNLVFDLSKTKIKNIGMFASNLGSVPKSSASIRINLSTPPKSMRSKSLFVYPKTLVQLGNTDISGENLVDSGQIHNLMFNIMNENGNINFSNTNEQPPITSLTGLQSDIVLGAIMSYRSNGSVFQDGNGDATVDWGRVIETNRAFVYNSNVLIKNGEFSLVATKSVNTESFFRDRYQYVNVSKGDPEIGTLVLNSNLNYIGDDAFRFGSYTIKSDQGTRTINNVEVEVFEHVAKIGNNAFYNIAAQNLMFSQTLMEVGSQAFSDSTQPINIYINKTEAFGPNAIQTTSFGGSDDDTINIYVPAGSALYKQLTGDGMGCKDRVHEYNFS